MRVLDVLSRVLCWRVWVGEEVRTREPVVVRASGIWEGNDGTWSTFEIGLGKPAQLVRVLPATASFGTAVAYKAVEEVSDDDDSDTSDDSGTNEWLFDTRKSLSWIAQSRLRTNNPKGENVRQYGLDTIQFNDGTEQALPHQPITAISDGNETIGQLGLGSPPTKFNIFEPSTASLSDALWFHGITPSSVWSYTAGAYYRGETAFGSLVFGGYDLSRYKGNSVGFTMSNEPDRELGLEIRSVSVATVLGETEILNTPISASIDSSIAELRLPKSVCDRFKEAFHLSFDSKRKLYLIDRHIHDRLQNSNPEITFALAASSVGASINITFPYLAFAQNLPSSSNDSEVYFPIRPISDPKSYKLGRTFLQEAYLTVNPSARVFLISQARFPFAPPRITALPSFASKSKPAMKILTRAIRSRRRSSRPSGGAIAGIVIAVVAVIIALTFVIWIILRKRRSTAKDISTGVTTDDGERGTGVEMGSPEKGFSHGRVKASDSLVAVNPPRLPETVQLPPMTQEMIAEPSAVDKPHETEPDKPKINTHTQKVKAGHEKELNSASPTDSVGTRLERRKSRFSEELFD